MAQNLAQRFLQLAPEERQRVHHHLSAQMLDEWLHFARQVGQLTYVDSVVGMAHHVDVQLPIDAFRAAFETRPAERDAALVAAIDQRYQEPIVALQAHDLELPDPILFGYYGLYNAFLKYVLQRPIDDWLIVNQLLSVETRSHCWQLMLEAAIEAATIDQT
jgi:hypothetical protein